MDKLPPAFKANDIRGKVPDEVNENLIYKISRSFAEELPEGGAVIIGRDARLGGKELAASAIRGMLESGINVVDIGLCGTEEVYFQTSYKQAAGGIMITASHNPKGYNGMKLVRADSKPVGSESGLKKIGERLLTNNFRISKKSGKVETDFNKNTYIEKLLGFVDIDYLKSYTILADPGNGVAGPIVQQLMKKLPFKFEFIDEKPDGNFPNGAPDPLKSVNQKRTSEAVKRVKADFGISWDGDCDRCFLFDASGRFIDGYYLVGLLGEAMAIKYPGTKIVHDHRLIWNTIKLVKEAGGVPVKERTGHVFMKERMRAENAIYGGELSSHHFFRDFYFCDSGMIPWLIVAELMSKKNKTLAQLVDESIAAFPCSGDRTYRVSDAQASIKNIQLEYSKTNGAKIDQNDGLSVEFQDWRFNVRSSNTEPVLRLTLETRGNAEIIPYHLAELENIIMKNE